jgi:hypothetical protein
MKKIMLLGVVTLSIGILTACSSNNSGEHSENNSSKSAQVKKTPIEQAQGKYITDDQKYFLTVNESDVMLGVSWSMSIWLAETDRGIQQNFLKVSDNKFVGKDSVDGKPISIKFSPKDNGNTLVLEFEESWLPGTFKDSSDKETLTKTSGSSLVFTKKSDEDYDKAKKELETLPKSSESSSSKKYDYKNIPSHDADNFVLSGGSSNYFTVSDKESGTYKIEILSGDNILLQVGSSEESYFDIFNENMAKNGENGFISEGYVTLSKGNKITISGGTVKFIRQ